MRQELKNLNGGSKQFWLRIHRKDVERYYFQYGPESTMAEFNMGQHTLERFLNRRGDYERIEKLSEADRWVLKVANEGIREVKRRVGELESWRAEVEPVIAVGRALIDATMIQAKAKVEVPTLPDDGASFVQLRGKS